MLEFFQKNRDDMLAALKLVHKCKDIDGLSIDELSDRELVMLYIAKTLKSLENFCEIRAEYLSAEIEKLKKELDFLRNENAKMDELKSELNSMKCALKQARSFNEFKSYIEGDFFC